VAYTVEGPESHGETISTHTMPSALSLPVANCYIVHLHHSVFVYFVSSLDFITTIEPNCL